eukprot:TRINITY_DN63430_c0_g1_i1.p2 TRINITY_DN63430_c0_g1~~TRINITY_DN63430_c0_g1_i1.p2  ORF type:complete len:204 (+),score=26.84 TRINITY_DN63430_c0_g1_i1:93-704(+)
MVLSGGHVVGLQISTSPVAHEGMAIASDTPPTPADASHTSFVQDTSAYGGFMSKGYVPPGQFEDLLNLVRQSSAAAERAMNAAKYAEMAASAAGAAGQQAVVRAMHMSNAPAVPVATPFAPGSPAIGQGLGAVGLSCVPLDPVMSVALFSAVCVNAPTVVPRAAPETVCRDSGEFTALASRTPADKAAAFRRRCSAEAFLRGT